MFSSQLIFTEVNNGEHRCLLWLQGVNAVTFASLTFLLMVLSAGFPSSYQHLFCVDVSEGPHTHTPE